MSWTVLGASLVTVFAVAALALWLGMGRGSSLGDRESVFALARGAHSGFRPEAGAIDREGRAALVIGAAGDAMLLKLHGAHPAARHYPEPPEAIADGPVLRIVTGEHMFGTIALDLGEAQASSWAARLARATDA